jgi:hypothetical protein
MDNIWIWVAVYVGTVSLVRVLLIGWPALAKLKAARATTHQVWDAAPPPIWAARSKLQSILAVVWAGDSLIGGWWSLHQFDRGRLLALPANDPRLKLRRHDLISRLNGRTDAGAKLFSDLLASSTRAVDVAAAQEYVDDWNDRAYERAGRTHQMAYYLMIALAVTFALAWTNNGPLKVAAIGSVGGQLSFGLRLLKGGAGTGGDNGLQWSRLLLAPVVGATSAVVGLMLVAGLVSFGAVGGNFVQVCTDIGYSAAACTTDQGAEDPESTSTEKLPHGSPSGMNGLGPLTMALAVGLAFSERLFQRWIAAAEEGFNPGGGGPDTPQTPVATSTLKLGGETS